MFLSTRIRFSNRLRRAAVAVEVAICLVPIISIVAIALDGGVLLDKRRQCQAVADAAALAAATDLYQNYRNNLGLDPNGTGLKSAITTAKAMGFPDDEVTADVTVNFSPNNYTGGQNQGKPIPPGYVEVIVEWWQTRSFSNIFASGTIHIQARSVARGIYVPGSIGVLILDPSSTDTCEIDGKLNINGTGMIQVNSSDPAAIRIYNSGSITASTINVVGTPGIQNNVGSGAINGAVNTGVSPAADPLANVPEPVPSGTNYGILTCSANTTINPGMYTALNVNSGVKVTMNPGIYYFTGPGTPGDLGGILPSPMTRGITMGSGATLTGNGVMIFNQSGDNLDFANAGPINLTPPATGTYQGISMWQPRSDSSEIHIISSNNITISGTLYAAKGLYDLRPQGAAVFNMANYICWQFEANQAFTDFGIGGGTTGTTNLNPSLGALTQRSIQLVE